MKLQYSELYFSPDIYERNLVKSINNKKVENVRSWYVTSKKKQVVSVFIIKTICIKMNKSKPIHPRFVIRVQKSGDCVGGESSFEHTQTLVEMCNFFKCILKNRRAIRCVNFSKKSPPRNVKKPQSYVLGKLQTPT